MQTTILARTSKGKEFCYSKTNVIEYPKTWTREKVNSVIEALNKHFNLSEDQTYYPYQIDQYDNILADYRLYVYKGKLKLKRLY